MRTLIIFDLGGRLQKLLEGDVLVAPVRVSKQLLAEVNKHTLPNLIPKAYI